MRFILFIFQAMEPYLFIKKYTLILITRSYPAHLIFNHLFEAV